MNNLIILNNEIYMLVKPVKSLFKSTMIHDVVTSGRKFAIKMSTGELTVINPSGYHEPEKAVKNKIQNNSKNF